MKKSLLIMAMSLSALMASAKDIKTVVLTTSPQMHCESCEKKIKGNLKFEKGVKQIDTNVAEQKVTVEYDADKTSADNIIAAFPKFGYTATRVGTVAENCCKAEKQECGKMQECGKKVCGGSMHAGARSSEKNAEIKAMSENQQSCCAAKMSCAGEKNTCAGKKEKCAEKKDCNGGCKKADKAGCCKD